MQHSECDQTLVTVCPRCQNSRVVFSKSCRRRIRCTLCTHRRADRTGRHLKELTRSQRQQELTGAEARRIARTIDALVVNALIEKLSIPGVPQHLATTDRVLQRWGAAATGLPAENPDVYRVSRPVALDDKTQEAVTDAVKAAPAGVRRFCFEWYDSDLPVPEIAKLRKMSRRQLGREWLRVLVAMRARFLASPHSDLRKLVHRLP